MHPLIASFGSVHSCCSNRGSTHRLVLICMPLFVQGLHWFQSLQLPPTTKKKIQRPVFRLLDVELCIGSIASGG